jgi:hypothetical protein
MPKKRRTPKSTELVSFRITQGLFKILEGHGKSLTEDSGQTLSAPMAARRIVIEALRKIDKSISDESAD